jgi:hypothetical protein
MSILNHRFGNFEDDYFWFINNHAAFRAEMVTWYQEVYGRPPSETDLNHGEWRVLVERNRWGTPRRALQEAWPKPIPTCPSLFDIPIEQRVGNFLWPPGRNDNDWQNWTPIQILKTEAEFRRNCDWHQAEGYKLLLCCAEWRIEPWNTPLVVESYYRGSQLGELVARLRMAREVYGLYPVLSILDRDLYDADSAFYHNHVFPNLLPQLAPYVCAGWDCWEPEKWSDASNKMRNVVNSINLYLTKPHGPHPGIGDHHVWYDDISAPDYWASVNCQLLYPQYGFDATAAQIEHRTRVLRGYAPNKKVMMGEGSIWNTLYVNPPHTLGQAGARGEAGMRGGAVGRMNG